MFIFVLFLDEIRWWKGDLEVSGLISCRVSNSCKFSYIHPVGPFSHTHWQRVLFVDRNEIRFDQKFSSGWFGQTGKCNHLKIFLHIHTVGPLSNMDWQLVLFSDRNGHRRHSSVITEISNPTVLPNFDSRFSFGQFVTLKYKVVQYSILRVSLPYCGSKRVKVCRPN